MKKIINIIQLQPTSVSIALGLFLIVWQGFSGAIPEQVQILLLAVSLFLTGIPHGALDHLVAQETLRRQETTTFNLLFFIAKYLLTMLVYGVFWYFLPSLSLYLFLIISAWHWGETDLPNVPNTLLWKAARFIFGVFVIGLLLLTHSEEVTPLWFRILRYDADGMAVWNFVYQYKTLFLSGFFTIFVFSFLLAQAQKVAFFDKKHYLQLLIILTICYFLPLLPAFALYFSGWHAVNAFYSIKKYLTADQNSTIGKHPLYIWYLSLPFTLLAFVFLAAVIFFWSKYLQHYDPLPLFYIFLSLITLPHLGVMHNVNRSEVSIM